MVGINSLDILNMDLLVEEKKIGKVKGVMIDPEEWKLTHLEVELTKDAAKEIFGSSILYAKIVESTCKRTPKSFRSYANRY